MAMSTRKETGSTILLLQVGDAKKVFKSNTEAHDAKPQQKWGQEEVYLPDSSLPMSFIHPHRHEKSVFTTDTLLLLPRKCCSKKQENNNTP
jgi:hypothetical protein